MNLADELIHDEVTKMLNITVSEARLGKVNYLSKSATSNCSSAGRSDQQVARFLTTEVEETTLGLTRREHFFHYREISCQVLL